jgi:hypothetical protein
VRVESDAAFGLVGVLVGSLTTSVLTIYKERFTARSDQLAKSEQFNRERSAARDTFQRESILDLQSAATDLIRAAYIELDRLIAEVRTSGAWNPRQWETPTAAGWSDAILRLEASRARVFDDSLRTLADDLRTVAGDSVWAQDLETAKERSRRIEPLLHKFNERVTSVLPNLYGG